jgi:hypothetical protein
VELDALIRVNRLTHSLLSKHLALGKDVLTQSTGI